MFKQVKTLLLVLIGIGVVGFVGIQFIPVDRSNPPIVSEPNWDSPETRALAERACFDCHSNETKWPWYSKIAPVSWLVVHDVQEGRAALNYSEWRPNQENESVEAIVEGEMPLEIYLMMHPEAQLTKAETQALIAGLNATFGPGDEGSGETESDSVGAGRMTDEADEVEDD